MPSRDELKLLQALPLELKIARTEQRIREWVNYYGVDGVYVSFSGGKDSTVLLDIARKLYPNIEAVFVDTGLEYPEIRKFVKTFDNVTILRPKMRFDEVISRYGYPIISKDVGECIWYAKYGSEKYKSQRLLKLNGELKDKNGNMSIYNLHKWKALLNMDFDISNKCCMIMKKSPLHKYNKKAIKCL